MNPAQEKDRQGRLGESVPLHLPHPYQTRPGDIGQRGQTVQDGERHYSRAMKINIQILARHLDGSLSAPGVAIGLTLVVSGIGGLLGLAADAYLVAIPLLAIFVLLLTVLTIAAVRTDPTPRLTPAERMARWKNAPTPLKWSLYILVAGNLLALFAGRFLPIAAGVPFMSIGISLSTLLMARYLNLHRPSIPRPGIAPLSEAEEPETYRRQIRLTVGVLYFTAVLFGIVACHMAFFG